MAGTAAASRASVVITSAWNYRAACAWAAVVDQKHFIKVICKCRVVNRVVNRVAHAESHLTTCRSDPLVPDVGGGVALAAAVLFAEYARAVGRGQERGAGVDRARGDQDGVGAVVVDEIQWAGNSAIGGDGPADAITGAGLDDFAVGAGADRADSKGLTGPIDAALTQRQAAIGSVDA